MQFEDPTLREDALEFLDRRRRRGTRAEAQRTLRRWRHSTRCWPQWSGGLRKARFERDWSCFKHPGCNCTNEVSTPTARCGKPGADLQVRSFVSFSTKRYQRRCRKKLASRRIWTRFWLHFGLQNRWKSDGTTEGDKKLKIEAPLQRNTRFCFPTRLPNRFKIASK